MRSFQFIYLGCMYENDFLNLEKLASPFKNNIYSIQFSPKSLVTAKIINKYNAELGSKQIVRLLHILLQLA
jgi:hypothetical protein